MKWNFKGFPRLAWKPHALQAFSMWTARTISKPYRVAVGLVASRQLSRLPSALASRVRQDLHALAEEAARTATGRPSGEPLSLRLPVEGYVARVDIDSVEGVVTLRDIDSAL
jgi:hypothetical protein